MPIFRTKNEDFFKNWSPEMAYVLGFFAADGCMIKNKREAHFIEFGITDLDLLENIRKELDSNHQITVRASSRKNWKESYRLQIGCKEMFYDLLKIGFTPVKSKTLEMPKVPTIYLKDFVRGYFDGDGNVTITEYKRADRKNKMFKTILSGFTCGSKSFLEDLHFILKKVANMKGGTLNFGSNAYRLYFSVNDTRCLYGFMYNNLMSELYLKRKKRVFEAYFKI